MIIWKSKTKKEEVAQFPDIGKRAWRNVIEIRPIDLEIRREVFFEDGSRKWNTAHVFFAINITKKFAFGSEHLYYDGPHCFFSVGFIHFYWQNNNCKKCYEES